MGRQSSHVLLLLAVMVLVPSRAQPEEQPHGPAWMPFQPSDFGGDDPQASSPQQHLTPEQAEQAVAKARRRAHVQHQLMSQFMRSFAKNMKYAILEDSAGDMPEEQRQAALMKLRGQPQRQQEFMPPPMEAGAMEPPLEVEQPSMLNGPRRKRHHHRHHQQAQQNPGEPPLLFGHREATPCSAGDSECHSTKAAEQSGPVLLPLRGDARPCFFPMYM
eukprot:CAMPEP_0178423910 /NCGR_PEP_ID=MMETSP0689_2-20121128/27932_1 /TAXON_ID=160604 /ORGANISM="Amphidinium massartii, Strain CS-259" /LENGTH=216 /DNA_ID=CAMNT_0020045519 /DNA_START=43 /DNA_END=690 /DNA_ORIENTATION=-